MQRTVEHDGAEHPLMRITTMGEFALERLVPAPARATDERARYARVARREWGNRGPAMALLKVLLCHVGRRASRDELIEAIWPTRGEINAAHALESAGKRSSSWPGSSASGSTPTPFSHSRRGRRGRSARDGVLDITALAVAMVPGWRKRPRQHSTPLGISQDASQER